MTGIGELLLGSSRFIDEWLRAPGPLSPLCAAVDIGGRALLDAGDAESAEAERYRISLERLYEELPEVERKLRNHITQVQLENGNLERARSWALQWRQSN